MTIITMKDGTQLTMRSRNKFKNVKCEWRGQKFDSKRELERHLILLDMQKRGEIFKLERQPRFAMLVNGITIGMYIGDWRYTELQLDETLKIVVEDAKGFQTPEFRLKWKFMKAAYPLVEWRTS